MLSNEQTLLTKTGILEKNGYETIISLLENAKKSSDMYVTTHGLFGDASFLKTDPYDLIQHLEELNFQKDLDDFSTAYEHNISGNIHTIKLTKYELAKKIMPWIQGEEVELITRSDKTQGMIEITYMPHYGLAHGSCVGGVCAVD